MSKAYVGSRVQSVDIGEELQNISRVIIVVDSDHVYTAGDDTGRTIERECPWGSQEMADALLQKLSAVTYKPFSAERAMLSPAFEIGDPVTIGGVYSQIVGADINYGVSGLVDIYAPDLDTTDDEYPAEKTQQSSITRELAKTRSSITKTAEQIRLEVIGELLDEEGNPISVASAITQTAEKITQEVTKSYQSYTEGRLGDLGTDEQGELVTVKSAISQTAESITLEVSKKIGDLGEDEHGEAYTVASKIEQTAVGITSTVTEKYEEYVGDRLGDLGEDESGKAYTVASKIEQTAEEITLEVTGYFDTDKYGRPVSVSSSITAALSGIELSAKNQDGSTTLTLTAEGGVEIESTFDCLTENDLGPKGKTTIYGGRIDTDSIYADALHLGGLLTVYDGEYSGDVGGYLGYDDGFASSSGIGIRAYQNGSGPQMVCTNKAARISYTAYAGGNITYQTGVVCGQKDLTLDAWQMIQIRLGTDLTATYDIDETGIYPLSGTETLGNQYFEWADVYAAGTSMSDLLYRIELIEAALSAS